MRPGEKCHRSQREGRCIAPGSQCKTPEGSGGRRQEQGDCLGQGFYCRCFCGKTRTSRANSLGLASVNNLGGIWAPG